MKISLFIILLVSLLASAPTWSKDASGAAIGRSCAGCHGTDGVSSGAAPTLRGKPAVVLASQLKGFKAGTTPSSIMGRIAKGYSDAELAAVAKYFSELR